MNDIIYFELNNWFSDRDYPNAEPFKTWCGNDLTLYFDSERWCQENKLVVTRGVIDQSINWCIGATKEWVEKTCPELLTKYTTFLRPDIKSHWDMPFIEYSEDNIGLHVCDLNYDTNKWEFYTEEEIKPYKVIWDNQIYGGETE